mmetsp:Transcript_58322/g.148093  ORF Transcript_58322/g.148093 Transcript_58322/m.148093 type:complete len:436 (-) Transcript_58322:49-1356(-)
MAWGGETGGRDMMGVHGDVLFADPLNVRGSKEVRVPPTQQHKQPYQPYEPYRSPLQQQQPPTGYGEGSPYSQASNSPSGGVRKEESHEEEDWGPVGNFMWWMVAGGKQCCSMRDRAKPADLDAKSRLPDTNRPPERQFPPAPPEQRRGLESFKLPDNPPASSSSYRGPDLNSAVFNTHDDLGTRPVIGGGGGGNNGSRPGGNGGGGYGASRGRDPDSDSDESVRSSGAAVQQQQSMTPPRFAAGGAGLGMGAQGRTASPAREEPTRPPVALAPPFPEPAPTRPQLTPPPEAAVSAAAPTRPQLQSGPTMGSGSVSRRWEWPTWCLNFKQPCIEVYVVDEDTGVGRWTNAEPQSRVVDKTGRDAYLCVEYEWDGEYYVQDFGPQHVRRRGHKETVFSLFEQAQADGAYDDLEKTKMAPGRGRDDGAGVMAFLDSSR